MNPARLYKPMLAHPHNKPFSSPDWLYEVKWDGIRAICYVKNTISVRGRNQTELNSKFPELLELHTLTNNVVLDGEIIVMSDQVQFQRILTRLQATDPQEITRLSQQHPITYIVFDILEKDGDPLLQRPLIERKQILRQRVTEGDYVILSQYVESQGEHYYQAILQQNLEGIIAKRKESPYVPGSRSRNWLKIKPVRSCDAIIVGYTPGQGHRASTFGALVLGLYDGERIVHVGQVGTGFTREDLTTLSEAFLPLRTVTPVLQETAIPKDVIWVIPQLIASIDFQSVTDEGKLRLSRYRGLRTDKSPRECTLDQIAPLTPLHEYRSKRVFTSSPEPQGTHSLVTNRGTGHAFVIQEHHARRLHYDLRLERDGVLKSWAVPKGVPMTQGEKRLAIQVEDHPLEYRTFEGVIPTGQYGAGTVKIFDSGVYYPKKWEHNKIEFILVGKILSGQYVLVKFKRAGENNWLLIKTATTND